MSDPLRRFHLLGPSDADKLLDFATSCKIELHRYPTEAAENGDDGQLVADTPTQSNVEISYELKGELPVTGRVAGELLAGLVRHFRGPRSGKDGAQ